MPTTTVAWFDSLTAGVQALGAAAREYRTAAQSARNAAWHTDPARLRPVSGSATVPGSNHAIRPHDDALWRLTELYATLRSSADELYENAAQAYAYGAAEAIRAVLDGDHPPFVEFGRRDGRYVLPNHPLPDLGAALDRWPGSADLDGFRRRVAEQQAARSTEREYTFFEDLADRESAEIAEARRVAAGLADSAYTYGEAAKSALHFTLLAEPHVNGGTQPQ
ncbi:hypothetical protein [Streptomyces sp. NBC_01497]|uniref:hypothetical protein n=1 Tax=Streptomyces sp. NBC_01497 TaxID=2903885 RepID=UPI002E2F350F|nr:hypothetical protein [Streptomyces sp. NBC_01497]